MMREIVRKILNVVQEVCYAISFFSAFLWMSVQKIILPIKSKANERVSMTMMKVVRTKRADFWVQSLTMMNKFQFNKLRLKTSLNFA